MAENKNDQRNQEIDSDSKNPTMKGEIKPDNKTTMPNTNHDGKQGSQNTGNINKNDTSKGEWKKVDNTDTDDEAKDTTHGVKKTGEDDAKQDEKRKVSEKP
jgi:hypothetical protein